MNNVDASDHDSPVDEAVVAYLEAQAGGKSPDRADYLHLAEFIDDADAVRRLMAPLREAACADSARTAPYANKSAIPDVAPFGDYERLEFLDGGGMGDVFKAWQVSLKRWVALKMIKADQPCSQKQIERFLAEARALARLQHPNIVPIHQVGEHNGRPYFAMEYLEGGNLATRLKQQLPSDQEAARIVELLARTAHYAHISGKGIFHRDLKPANVLLTRDDIPKIADFGLAKVLSGDDEECAQTFAGAVVGTASYMAPEQAAGMPDVGPAADVYALGAILYELLTGTPPFKAASRAATLKLVREQPPDRPRDHNRRVDLALEAICLKCLKKQPADRYRSAEALAEDLAAYLRGERPIVDQGTARWVLAAVLRESRYTEVMTLWSGFFMGTAILFFLVCLAKSMLLWSGEQSHGPYYAIWLSMLVADIGLVWFFRLRGQQRLTLVERQMAQVKCFFWAGLFLTAWQFQRAGGAPADVVPILTLQAAVCFGCMAAILGGSFYVMAAVCVAAAVLEAAWPDVGPLVSGIVASPALFWLGWKYWRRMPGR